MTDDPRIEAFFSAEGPWRAELRALRQLLLAEPLDEVFKWRGPVYTAQGRNVATLWGLKEACTLSFFKGVLLDDPQGLLEAPGEASRSVRVVKLRSLAEIEAKADALAALIRQAIDDERAGRRVDLPPDDFDLPEELAERLAADPDLAAAWEALTPGRRRGWALQIGRAKASATRLRRLEAAAPRILAGKGMHDR
ncbi:YdeI/OmpD-associated family protein [Albimonas sp. CAU 1670]|uniref:YdeI/OmpD-associated family protein n=1 Tax=Albimonas sp. CAU 1670 TaxID=3032599 RepID=UPI0023DAFD69|nr:YdeI/OmpD-associated family protein [Albimonas sp. CAU 1670]MDF2231659.1 YdeI/OmpD-associated family protein [Albimonas sp. CAU 1670]